MCQLAFLLIFESLLSFYQSYHVPKVEELGNRVLERNSYEDTPDVNNESGFCHPFIKVEVHHDWDHSRVDESSSCELQGNRKVVSCKCVVSFSDRELTNDFEQGEVDANDEQRSESSDDSDTHPELFVFCRILSFLFIKFISPILHIVFELRETPRRQEADADHQRGQQVRQRHFLQDHPCRSLQIFPVDIAWSRSSFKYGLARCLEDVCDGIARVRLAHQDLINMLWILDNDDRCAKVLVLAVEAIFKALDLLFVFFDLLLNC